MGKKKKKKKKKKTTNDEAGCRFTDLKLDWITCHARRALFFFFHLQSAELELSALIRAQKKKKSKDEKKKEDSCADQVSVQVSTLSGASKKKKNCNSAIKRHAFLSLFFFFLTERSSVTRLTPGLWKPVSQTRREEKKKKAHRSTTAMTNRRYSDIHSHRKTLLIHFARLFLFFSLFFFLQMFVTLSKKHQRKSHSHQY